MSNIRVAEYEVRAVAAAPTPEDLQIIGGPEYAGRSVDADEVIVRRMRLAHNQHDRTGERFLREHLERFAETAVGKSVLVGHDTGSAPVGMFFRSDVRSRQEQAFPVIAGGSEGDGWARRFRWENRNLRVTWLETDFYAPAGTETARNVDLGIWKWVSIGFTYDDLLCDVCRKSYWSGDCPHIIGRMTDDGKLVTATYGGETAAFEMREGSIVYLGAQQQARLVKQLRDGAIDADALARTPWGEDLVARKEAEYLARRYGHAQKAWAFPHFAHGWKGNEQRPSGNPEAPCEGCLSTDCAGCPVFDGLIGANGLPVGGHTDPAQPVGAQGEATMTDEEKAALDAAIKRADGAEAVATRLKGELEAAKANPLAGVGTAALKDLRQQILDDDLRLTGKAENPELADLLALHVEKANYARLREIASAKRAAVLEKFPAVPAGTPTRQDEEQMQEPDPALIRRDARLR